MEEPVVPLNNKMKQMKNRYIYFAIAALVLLMNGCDCGCNDPSKALRFNSGKLWLEIDTLMQMRITDERQTALLDSAYFPSEYLVTRHRQLTAFRRTYDTLFPVSDSIGKGERMIIKGTCRNGRDKIEKIVTLTRYDNFKDMVVFNTCFVNKGNELTVTKWVSNRYTIDYDGSDTLMWSFQGGTTMDRDDWIRPVSNGFYRENYLGMTSSDYGGGIPVTDVWRRDAGVAVGHLNMFPLRLSLPVESDNETGGVQIGIEKAFDEPLVFAKNDTLELPQTFVMTHTGDCFVSLHQFSEIMQKKGIRFPEPEPAAFEPVWCAWGYERNVTLKEITGTLPKVKELGFKWAVIDDGYQQAEGDWDVNKTKFPGGSKQMKALTDKIHSYGLKAKLWYAPLAVDPCTKLLKKNPDVLLFNIDWSPRYITWWDSYYMSPAYEKTRTITAGNIRMFLHDWGFDGLKLDGQHMNAVPPDYNPDHNLEYPEQACEQLPDFFRMIYDTARAIKPHVVVEHCPCGTCMSFYNMQTTNQTVSSDPLSSWQIRLKGKVYKALLGKTAYYGDHVELSDGRTDFASTIGIGGVPGSKFTWPKDNPTASESFLLTPEKEKIWKKWLDIYYRTMLSKGNYLGQVYDIGFDKPEGHLIAKGDTLYYAFYAKHWKGKIQLKGLSANVSYTVTDYENNKNLGKVSRGNNTLNCEFEKHLLLMAVPVEGDK